MVMLNYVYWSAFFLYVFTYSVSIMYVAEVIIYCYELCTRNPLWVLLVLVIELVSLLRLDNIFGVNIYGLLGIVHLNTHTAPKTNLIGNKNEVSGLKWHQTLMTSWPGFCRLLLWASAPLWTLWVIAITILCLRSPCTISKSVLFCSGLTKSYRWCDLNFIMLWVLGII